MTMMIDVRDSRFVTKGFVSVLRISATVQICNYPSRVLVKHREYARSMRLEGDASKGKPAVDLSLVQNWAGEEINADEEEVETNEDGTIIKLNVSCYFCKKKGHSITQCRLVQQLKRKGKGESGKSGKGRGKGKDTKGPSKGRK